jgi:hypothetical protein
MASLQKSRTIPLAEEFMRDFARSTGLEPAGEHPRRYLWTDAFAVCNYLELYDRTGEHSYLDLAGRLVDQVHHVLGWHREDDDRTGWISGLSEAEGELHPTAGGLRIGKRLNERGPHDLPDPRLEWEQDGQYYHYLTKWMHALARMGRVTGDDQYVLWGMELAKAAHAAFTYSPGISGKRMYWKMSIDLRRPQVPSMGQHDPLDGLVTYSELVAAARSMGLAQETGLGQEIDEMRAICGSGNWVTDDALGIGGLFADAYRIVQLMDVGVLRGASLLDDVLAAGSLSLGLYGQSGDLLMPAQYRLAFRELGLAIGLQGLERTTETVRADPPRFGGGPALTSIDQAMAYAPLSGTITTFWTEAPNRSTPTWKEHRDINTVMLVTSLAPKAFLLI